MGIQNENWIQRHQITVDQYYQLAQVGLLSPDDRVELIEGEIFDKASIGSEHAGLVNQLTARLNQAAGNRAIVATQNPLRLSEQSEPQPDVALLRFRNDFYRRNHPTAADALLVIEVAQTSIRYDREVKLPLYAKHGIPEAWIVDLDSGQLCIFRDPQDARYLSETTTTQPGKLILIAMPDVGIDLTGLF